MQSKELALERLFARSWVHLTRGMPSPEDRIRIREWKLGP